MEPQQQSEPVTASSLRGDSHDSHNLLNKFDSLTQLDIVAYGVGHLLNDLTASCWFNYLLFYLKVVVRTPVASITILTGQLCDAVATPVIGWASDRYSTVYGRRTPWYICGMIIVVCCFIPLFSNNHSGAFYVVLGGIFNVGWAAGQISHLSLVPALTCSRKRRDKLNNLRNSFTYAANFIVLFLALTVSSIPSAEKYQWVVYSSVAIGTLTSLYYIWKIREVPLTQQCKNKRNVFRAQMQDAVGYTKAVPAHWLRYVGLGVCYMCIRQPGNIIGTFISFYLSRVLINDNIHVTLIPLSMYCASTLVSSRMNQFYNRHGRKTALILGTFLCIFSLILMRCIDKRSAMFIYVPIMLFGCSQSMITSTGVNLVSDVVKAENVAMLYGVYSFMDKVATGFILYFLSSSPVFSKGIITKNEGIFILDTLTLVPGVCCVIVAAVVAVLKVQEYGNQEDEQFARSIQI